MKFTIVMDDKGELVGAMQGHAARPDTAKAPASANSAEFRAGLMAGPGQTLHEVEIPDEIAHLKDPEEFGRRLAHHVRETGLAA